MSFESVIYGRELKGSPSVCTWEFVVVIDCGRQQQIIWVRSHVLLAPNSKGCFGVMTSQISIELETSQTALSNIAPWSWIG